MATKQLQNDNVGERDCSPDFTQVGVVTLEKVVPLMQVIVLLPFSKNPSLQDTVSSVPASTGNAASVLRSFHAGSSAVHASEEFYCHFYW